jgi:hypothetical protein
MEELVQLLPLAQKQRGGRRTMKRGRIQKGGANWVVIPDDTRRKAWKDALAADPSWTDMYDTLFADARPDQTDDAEKKKAVLQYVNAVMRQDDLMMTALKIIRNKYGITDATTDILEKAAVIPLPNRGVDNEYVLDVQRIVTFLTTVDTKSDSKIKKLTSSPEEPMSTLVLYPARFKNIFIEALAVIAIQIKYNQNAPMRTPLMDTDAIKKIQADHFKSYAEGQAYHNTAYGLRDGFYLDQPVGTFTSIIAGRAQSSAAAAAAAGNFWLKFVTSLRTYLTAPDTINNILGDAAKSVTISVPLGPNPSYSELSGKWAEISAAIVASYIISPEPIWGTFTLLKRLNKGAKPAAGTGAGAAAAQNPNEAFIPNASLRDVEIGDTGMTLESLYAQFPTYVVHFILHLSYTIQKLEPTVKNMVLPAIAAAAGTP